MLRFAAAGFTGQWDIALADLDRAIGGLDDDHDGVISPEEVNRHKEAMANYVTARLEVRTDGVARKIRITDFLTIEHFDHPYFALRLALDGPGKPENLEVNYRLFFDLNPPPRGILLLDFHGKQQSAIFSPDQPDQRFEFSAPSGWQQLFSFGREGVRHIWSGFDHILFLLALLLPSVVRGEAGRWQAVPDFRPACVNVLKIVTAFTVAHSITLSLATLGLAHLPSRFVESAIAASIVLAAANNLHPFFHERGWLVAFGFGLVHGFGFASGLKELGLVQANLALALVGFNLGVEMGQLAIVGCFLPLAYALRSSWFYRRVALGFGSSLIILVAFIWMVERVFSWKLPLI